MRVSIIAAMGKNRVIGDDQGLPWRLPRDLRRFRDLTWGKPVLMGRKTLELIGRPLPGRDNVVLTRNHCYAEHGFHVAHDVPAALASAQRLLSERGQSYLATTPGPENEVMVIGGGEVYRQFIPMADRVYLTIVEGVFPGTATFPFEELAAMVWHLFAQEFVPADTDAPHAHRFFILDRVRATVPEPALLLEPTRLLAG